MRDYLLLAVLFLAAAFASEPGGIYPFAYGTGAILVFWVIWRVIQKKFLTKAD